MPRWEPVLPTEQYNQPRWNWTRRHQQQTESGMLPTWSAWVADRVRGAARRTEPIPEARTPRRSQLAPCLVVLVVAFSLAACSATHQVVQPDGDILVRTGPSALGWVPMFFGMIFVAVFIPIFLVIAVGITGSELVRSVHSRKFLQAVGLMLLIPIIIGFVGAITWGVAANTAFKYQTAIVTASSTRKELKVEQERLLGSDSVRTWRYEDIAMIEFDYIPASGGGDNYTPPQGFVYVRGSEQVRSRIFDGSACPARKLADAVASATGAPIRVHVRGLGGRDVASIGSFLTQMRCGIEHPFRPSSWRQYPAEAWRVLDLPFLWQWPWAVPIIVGQLALIAGALAIIAQWRKSACSTLLMVSVCVVVGLSVVAMNVFAARSYGSWPTALALLVLILARFVARRLATCP
jgi:hypothetical protein